MGLARVPRLRAPVAEPLPGARALAVPGRLAQPRPQVRGSAPQEPCLPPPVERRRHPLRLEAGERPPRRALVAGTGEDHRLRLVMHDAQTAPQIHPVAMVPRARGAHGHPLRPGGRHLVRRVHPLGAPHGTPAVPRWARAAHKALGQPRHALPLLEAAWRAAATHARGGGRGRAPEQGQQSRREEGQAADGRRHVGRDLPLGAQSPRHPPLLQERTGQGARRRHVGAAGQVGARAPPLERALRPLP
mmetsp:Transcript_12170/g.28374  ORF Transcript_12170/g.28374 Transcript_12170/m.28374 type:complete len:246 (-) Transcript_12170:189-926(-)